MKKLPIIETFIILAISGGVLEFGRLTLRNWDSSEWWKLTLSAIATVCFFALLLFGVKTLIDHKDNKK